MAPHESELLGVWAVNAQQRVLEKCTQRTLALQNRCLLKPRAERRGNGGFRLSGVQRHRFGYAVHRTLSRGVKNLIRVIRGKKKQPRITRKRSRRCRGGNFAERLLARLADVVVGS